MLMSRMLSTWQKQMASQGRGDKQRRRFQTKKSLQPFGTKRGGQQDDSRVPASVAVLCKDRSKKPCLRLAVNVQCSVDLTDLDP